MKNRFYTVRDNTQYTVRDSDRQRTKVVFCFLACPHKDPLHGVYQRKHQKAVSIQVTTTAQRGFRTKILKKTKGRKVGKRRVLRIFQNGRIAKRIHPRGTGHGRICTKNEVRYWDELLLTLGCAAHAQRVFVGLQSQRGELLLLV